MGAVIIGANCPGLSRTVPEKYTMSRVPDGDSFVPEFKGQLTETNNLASIHFVEQLNTRGGVKNRCFNLKREKFAAFAYNCKIADKSAILKYA